VVGNEKRDGRLMTSEAQREIEQFQNWLEEVSRVVGGFDGDAAQACQAALDQKTKPHGSLGRLEGLACKLAGIRGTAQPSAQRAAVVIFAADHGIAAEGVSAFPQEVTGQMLRNFANGGAAINVLSRSAGAELSVHELGLAQSIDLPDVILRHALGPGTANICESPAMSRDQLMRALAYGIAFVERLAARGTDVIALGDMGIANTSASAALIATYLNVNASELERLVGRGTGVSDENLLRKRDAIARAVARHQAEFVDKLGHDSVRAADILASLGGFEIAGLAGVVIGAAKHRIGVMVDGVITTAAALAAVRIVPRSHYVLMASHLSPEPAHRLALDSLGLDPLFDLQLRLGEGTGAVLALPILRSAALIAEQMATFEQAAVSAEIRG
jgi:nicotinate-nucleotide--dimethylbenzimidazole phosphoribosyltransferase